LNAVGKNCVAGQGEQTCSDERSESEATTVFDEVVWSESVKKPEETIRVAVWGELGERYIEDVEETRNGSEDFLLGVITRVGDWHWEIPICG
jgi:hypothetical protein